MGRRRRAAGSIAFGLILMATSAWARAVPLAHKSTANAKTPDAAKSVSQGNHLQDKPRLGAPSPGRDNIAPKQLAPGVPMRVMGACGDHSLCPGGKFIEPFSLGAHYLSLYIYALNEGDGSAAELTVIGPGRRQACVSRTDNPSQHHCHITASSSEAPDAPYVLTVINIGRVPGEFSIMVGLPSAGEIAKAEASHGKLLNPDRPTAK